MNTYFASDDNESLDQILHNIGDAICITDGDLIYRGANQRYASFYGLQPQDLMGKNVLEIYPDFKKSVFYDACERCIKTGETVTRFGFASSIQNWMVTRVYKFKENRYIMVAHLLSGGNAKTDYAHYVDTLTSLPNRFRFESDIEKLYQYGQKELNLILIDISHFKEINETLGIQNGDLCLMEIAARLKQAVLKEDRVYRIGNDQFLIMGNGREEDLIKKRDSIAKTMTSPLTIGNSEFVLQFHAGIYTSTEQESGDKALNKAEKALSLAKNHKVQFAKYTDAIKPTNYNPSLVKSIQDAITHEEFVLYFQPKVDLIDETLCSAEVLVRWNHPTKGFLPPSEFIPFAEETHLIRDIDKYVVRKTFEYVQKHQKSQNMLLALNLSAQSLCSIETLTYFKEMLEKTKINPKSICIEIVETANMHDIEISQKVVEKLKEMGFKIAIDDFGTGYSSISYLVKYPAHFIKIDRSFIQDITENHISQTMVKNMIGLAHGLKMMVVAEGIETREELNMLKRFRCDIGQGYFFSKPIDEASFEKWVDVGFSSLESEIR